MSENHPKKQGKFVPTLKYTAIAIVASSIFLAIVLLAVDRIDMGTGNSLVVINSGLGEIQELLSDESLPNVVIINSSLGEGNLPFSDALVAGFILSILPIFLFVVLSFTGMVVFLGLVFALLSVAIALAIPAGIMAFPLLLIIGLVYLLMRKKSTD